MLQNNKKTIAQTITRTHLDLTTRARRYNDDDLNYNTLFLIKFVLLTFVNFSPYWGDESCTPILIQLKQTINPYRLFCYCVSYTILLYLMLLHANIWSIKQPSIGGAGVKRHIVMLLFLIQSFAYNTEHNL